MADPAPRTVPTRRRRRQRHVVGLVALSMVAAGVAWMLLPGNTPRSQRLSLILAYESLAAVLVTLALGPLNVMRDRPNPTSFDLRRDVGLLAALTGLAHVVLSLQHHFGGDVGEYFFTTDGGTRSLRTDQFGIANWIGLLGTIVVLVLASISNDVALRRFGRRWKPLQRANYLLVAIVIGHTVLFWRILDRNVGMRVASVLAFGVVAALQLGGIAVVRRSARLPSSVL